jgi:aryl-alcohol dehydrogenase-like predicted oxidoreductase
MRETGREESVMEYTHLGRSGLQVSRLCLGTMNFGPQTSEPDAHAIMDAALENGINFFDTANAYGRPIKAGLTEEIIGRWSAQGGDRREKIVLATKVYSPMTDWPNHGGLSALSIRDACDASLRRLQTDHIDLYQMHHVDRETPWEEIWQAMDVLVRQGKIIYTGSSNFAAWNIVEANETASGRGIMGLVSEQSLYNLMDRMVELEVIPACMAYGVGIIPWSPLGRGMLGGVLDRHTEGRRSRLTEQVEQNRDKLQAYEELCEEIGEPPAAVALAWLLENPAVTAPIIGPRTMEQLKESFRALEIELSDDVLERLDQIFPSPGGQAPEAYAW